MVPAVTQISPLLQHTSAQHRMSRGRTHICSSIALVRRYGAGGRKLPCVINRWLRACADKNKTKEKKESAAQSEARWRLHRYSFGLLCAAGCFVHNATRAKFQLALFMGRMVASAQVPASVAASFVLTAPTCLPGLEPALERKWAKRAAEIADEATWSSKRSPAHTAEKPPF